MTPPIIRITWLDACADSDWLAPDAIRLGLVPIQSVGFLVKHTPTALTIAQSLDFEGKSGERLTVPTDSIQDLQYLSITLPDDSPL